MINFNITCNVINYFKREGSKREGFFEEYISKSNLEKGIIFKDIYTRRYDEYTNSDLHNLYMVFYLLCIKHTGSFNHFKRDKIAREYLRDVEKTPTNEKYNKILNLINILAI